MEAIQNTFFDYAELDAETRIVVQQEDKEFDHNISTVGISYVRACHNLDRIHRALRYKRPGFVDYVSSKPGLSIGTAHKMLNVARMFSESENIPIASKEALNILAAPDTPDDVRDAFIARAKAGETITHGMVNGHKEGTWHLDNPATMPASMLPADHPYHPHNLPEFTGDPQRHDRFVRDNEALGLETVLDEETGELIDIQPKDDWYNRPSLQTMHPAHRVLHMSANQGGSNEWYTPEYLVEAARETMGKIDLDPASCDYANRIIKAETIYTEAQDGLAQPWYGCMWMNPPYGKDEETNRSNQERWLDRLIEEYRDPSGNLDQAMIILNAVTDRKWFARLWDYPLCFTGRVYFYSETVARGSPTHGSVIAYFGSHTDRFVAAYRPHGRIVLPKGWYNEVAA